MLKKLSLSLLVITLSAIFCASLFAQVPTPPPLTQADIDLFIKISLEPDAAKKAALMAGGGDPMATAGNQAKVTTIAAMLMQGQDDPALIKTALSQSPMTAAITDEEIKLVTDQKAAVVDALKVASSIQ